MTGLPALHRNHHQDQAPDAPQPYSLCAVAGAQHPQLPRGGPCYLPPTHAPPRHRGASPCRCQSAFLWTSAHADICRSRKPVGSCVEHEGFQNCFATRETPRGAQAGLLQKCLTEFYCEWRDAGLLLHRLKSNFYKPPCMPLTAVCLELSLHLPCAWDRWWHVTW